MSEVTSKIAADFESYLLSWISSWISNRKHLINLDLNKKTSLFEAGLDSMDAIELTKDLEKLFTKKLPADMILRHKTVKKISNYLSEIGCFKVY